MPASALHFVTKAGSFIARHVLACAVVTGAACVLCAALYLLLFLWAVFAGGGIGSPAALPLGLLFTAISSLIACLLLYFPATALADRVASRRGLKWWQRILLGLAIHAGLCLLWIGVAALFPDMSFDEPETVFPVSAWQLKAAVRAAFLFLLTLPALPVYWLTSQGIPIVFAIARGIRDRIPMPRSLPSSS